MASEASPAAATHRVARMHFDLEGADERLLQAWRSALAAGAESWIPAALEQAFDSVEMPGETIRIERLEIDLGTLRGQTITPDLLRNHVAAGLVEAMRKARSDASGVSTLVPGKSESRTAVDALAAFLVSGAIPWWSPAETLQALAAMLLSGGPASLQAVARLLAPALRQEKPARRFILQFPAAAGGELLAAISDRPQLAPAEEWARVLTLARGEADELDAAVQQVRTLANTGRSDAPADGDGPGRFQTGSRDRAAGTDFTPAGDGAEVEPDFETPPGAEPAPAAADGPLVAPDAGLVLAGVYLPALFGNLGLTQDDQFIDEAAQSRAVYLTGFLANPADDPSEPGLIMARLLCGWPLAEPLPRIPALTPKEKDEAESLLAAMIAHWQAIGSTSLDGLRETFLSRPGLLRAREAHWQLTVERRAFDVLLDRLPWPLSLVKQPWIPKPIMVDWA